jgi:hypothetical protein
MSSSEDTLIGNDFRFQVGDGNSPETFLDMCAVSEANDIGEEAPLIDTTTLCDLARTHRRGLPDGAQFPLVVNFIQGDTQSHDLYNAFKDKTRLNFRMTIANSSPAEYIGFTAIVLGWKLTSQSGEKASITYTLKVTGDVTWVFAEAA